MKKALGSSETLVLTRVTRRNIQKTEYFLVTAVRTSNLTSLETITIGYLWKSPTAWTWLRLIKAKIGCENVDDIHQLAY
jgi:hypothetical protein